MAAPSLWLRCRHSHRRGRGVATSTHAIHMMHVWTTVDHILRRALAALTWIFMCKQRTVWRWCVRYRHAMTYLFLSRNTEQSLRNTAELYVCTDRPYCLQAQWVWNHDVLAFKGGDWISVAGGSQTRAVMRERIATAMDSLAGVLSFDSVRERSYSARSRGVCSCRARTGPMQCRPRAPRASPASRG